jgi:transcriptional regulator with XRE-family HTH domain
MQAARDEDKRGGSPVIAERHGTPDPLEDGPGGLHAHHDATCHRGRDRRHDPLPVRQIQFPIDHRGFSRYKTSDSPSTTMSNRTPEIASRGRKGMGPQWHQQLGARIARFRLRAGMTQEQLGTAAGVGASYIARIEMGTRRPTLDVLGAIGDGLGLPLHRLVVDDRLVRNGDSPAAWGRAGKMLSAVVVDLDDADVELLVKVAARIRGR